MPTNSPYCAAKGGVRMLMRTIAVELAPHGIPVNNIAPGAIETPINRNLDEHPEQRQELLSEIPLGKIGQPEDVAFMALYLASDASSYSTGSTFFVDGGMMRQAGSL
jgi:glucose 1-dehydrogenase